MDNYDAYAKLKNFEAKLKVFLNAKENIAENLTDVINAFNEFKSEYEKGQENNE